MTDETTALESIFAGQLTVEQFARAILELPRNVAAVPGNFWRVPIEPSFDLTMPTTINPYGPPLRALTFRVFRWAKGSHSALMWNLDPAHVTFGPL